MYKLFLTALLAIGTAMAHAKDAPPHDSSMWNYYHQRLLNNQDFIFDDRVQVKTPPFAEDARQVPLEIDARSLPGTTQKIMLWAELNPIPQIMVVKPGEQLENLIAVRIRVEQATHVRAAFLQDDGLWHVGTGHIEAAGGGCTAPSVIRAEEGWEKHVGNIFGARHLRDNSSFLRMRISHPMDNGLSGNIPEYFIDHAQLRDDSGQVLADFELFASISENPTLTLALKGEQQARLWLRDNNGNEFRARF